MRKLAMALIATLLLTAVPVTGAGADTIAATGGDDAVAAKKKKKCKKGYILKKVKRKKRVRGKVRTVKVKRCVKKKRKKKAKTPAAVSCPSPYLGRATGMDGVFQYGDVRVDRTCGAVTRVEIKAVSTNCGGFNGTYVVVFNPSSPDILITGGSPAIAGNKMHVVYRPDKTSANQTTMDITFAGKTATGEFHSIGNCKQDGLFTANAG